MTVWGAQSLAGLSQPEPATFDSEIITACRRFRRFRRSNVALLF